MKPSVVATARDLQRDINRLYSLQAEMIAMRPRRQLLIRACRFCRQRFAWMQFAWSLGLPTPPFSVEVL